MTTYTDPSVAAVNVELECHQAFQVFDLPKASKMLVRPYPAAEAAYAACAALSSDRRFAGQRARVTAAAKKRLADSQRETCTVTAVSELTLTDYEATYACPAAVKPPGAKAPGVTPPGGAKPPASPGAR